MLQYSVNILPSPSWKRFQAIFPLPFWCSQFASKIFPGFAPLSCNLLQFKLSSVPFRLSPFDMELSSQTTSPNLKLCHYSGFVMRKFLSSWSKLHLTSSLRTVIKSYMNFWQDRLTSIPHSCFNLPLEISVVFAITVFWILNYKFARNWQKSWNSIKFFL